VNFFKEKDICWAYWTICRHNNSWSVNSCTGKLTDSGF